MSFDDFKRADGGEPADGLHTATLENSSVFESQKGDTFIKLWWQTTDHAHSWESLHGTTGAAKRFTQEVMVVLGVDFLGLSSWDALDNELRARLGTVYEVRVQHSGTFLNTYVESLADGVQEELPIDQTGLPEPVATSAGSVDEDIPF